MRVCVVCICVCLCICYVNVCLYLYPLLYMYIHCDIMYLSIYQSTVSTVSIHIFVLCSYLFSAYVFLYRCMYVFRYMCLQTCMHICTRMRIYIYIYTCVCLSVTQSIYVYQPISIYLYILYIYIYISMCVYACSWHAADTAPLEGLPILRCAIYDPLEGLQISNMRLAEMGV